LLVAHFNGNAAMMKYVLEAFGQGILAHIARSGQVVRCQCFIINAFQRGKYVAEVCINYEVWPPYNSFCAIIIEDEHAYKTYSVYENPKLECAGPIV
jgi:hypothetical protein